MNCCDNFTKTLHNFVRILSSNFLDDFNVPIQNKLVNNFTSLSKSFPSTTPLCNFESCTINYGHLEFTQISFYSFFLLSKSCACTGIQDIPVITLNFSTHAYLAFDPLTCIFCQAINELLFLKTHFLKMYAPCTNISHVHTLVAPLQLAYVCMLRHHNPRILAKVEKNKKLQGIH
jgi:hypothetical protein